jgi:hypothetical protein
VRKIAERLKVNPSIVQAISMELAGRPFAQAPPREAQYPAALIQKAARRPSLAEAS